MDLLASWDLAISTKFGVMEYRSVGITLISDFGMRNSDLNKIGNSDTLS
jgi:hypothetical protein